MKIIAFSDTHGNKLEWFDPQDADICVIAGDIAPLRGFSMWDLRKQERWMNVVFGKYCADHPNTEFVFIAGNHDFWGERIQPSSSMWAPNAHYLRNGGCTVKGLKFYGAPQVPYIGAERRWAFESSSNALLAAFSNIPEDTDILITHSPPRIEGSNIDSSGVDIATGEMTHFGSCELYDAVLEKQPRLLFCGHIHTGDHNRNLIGKTECYNVSMLDEGYNIKFKPRIVTI